MIAGDFRPHTNPRQVIYHLPCLLVLIRQKNPLSGVFNFEDSISIIMSQKRLATKCIHLPNRIRAHDPRQHKTLLALGRADASIGTLFVKVIFRVNVPVMYVACAASV